MSHHCSDHSCSQGGGSSHQFSKEGEHTCCNCGCHHDKQRRSFARELLDLTDEAWMELLKEKIKEHIDSTRGSQLEELAKLVSEANNSRWHDKLHKLSGVRDYEQKIEDFFKKASS